MEKYGANEMRDIRVTGYLGSPDIDHSRYSGRESSSQTICSPTIGRTEHVALRVCEVVG